MSIFWAIFAIVMAAVEAMTVQLVSIWFAIGGATACITSLITDNIIIQIVVFVVVSALALIVTRPIVKKMKQKGAQPTNADRYIGKTAIVITAIDNDNAQGMVKVDNEKWTARSLGGDQIPEGESVTVKSIEGVKLIVERK